MQLELTIAQPMDPVKTLSGHSAALAMLDTLEMESIARTLMNVHLVLTIVTSTLLVPTMTAALVVLVMPVTLAKESTAVMLMNV